MDTRIGVKKWWVAVGVCAALAAPLANASAAGRDRDRDHRREVVVVRHQRYNYHDGRFFRPGWFGLEFSIVAPPFGAVVTRLPFGYRTIVVGGVPYYQYNNVYYRSCPTGYVVVPETEVINVATVAPVMSVQGDRVTVTINVPNANGGYTPITLLKHNDGYVGPQGEYYPGNPTVEQLRALYGK